MAIVTGASRGIGAAVARAFADAGAAVAVAARDEGALTRLADEITAAGAAAVWLCSDEAAYVTGATLVIDGGKLAGPPPFAVRRP